MKLNELEIKIQIASEEHFLAVYESCNKLFGAPISHVLQLDEYYDTPDGQLKKQDLVIRIRSNGEKKTIALKSPRIELPSGMANRIELEFLSAEGEKVHEQLLSLRGLRIQRQKPVQVIYKGIAIREPLFVDVLVEDKVSC